MMEETQEAIQHYGGKVFEHKQTSVNGISVGEFTGLLATWDPDTGGRFGIPDQFVQGAFLESLEEHRARDNRQIRLKDHHGRTIGGFPIEFAKETSEGLLVTGHVNLEVEQGREAFSLMKQKVLTDLSIGWISLEDSIIDDVRVITKAIIAEGSLISEPANRAAVVTEIKRATVDQIKNYTARELENFLVESGSLSHKAARYLVHKNKEDNEEKSMRSILDDLKDIKQRL